MRRGLLSHFARIERPVWTIEPAFQTVPVGV